MYVCVSLWRGVCVCVASSYGFTERYNVRRLLVPFAYLCKWTEEHSRLAFATSGYVIWTKWLQTTRLETRTKESKMCASVWVLKTETRNESKQVGIS